MPYQIDLTDRSLSDQAVIHASERREAIGRTLVTVGAFSVWKLTPVGCILSVAPARWQWQKGKKRDHSEAAHVTLMVEADGRPLTDYTADPFAITAVQGLQTQTHRVHVLINRVDTDFERRSLRPGLQTCLREFTPRMYGCTDMAEIESNLISSGTLIGQGAVETYEDMIKDYEAAWSKGLDNQKKKELDDKIEIAWQSKQVWTPHRRPSSLSRPQIENCINILKPEGPSLAGAVAAAAAAATGAVPRPRL